MVVAAEIHTATRVCAWNIFLPTPLASAFAATLYQVHHICRGWRIQTSYWSIRVSVRVKLPTTIDRRRKARVAFPSLSPNHCFVMYSLNMLCNTPVTLHRDYTELARRCDISQSAVGSPKNAENRCILFSIFIPWRCHGVPTGIVAFLRRFHGVLSRSRRVLVGDRLRANGVLTACHSVHTAC